MNSKLYQDLAVQFFTEGHRNHTELGRGLVEEAKEVVDADTIEEVLDELGDVLWYVSTIANLGGYTLEDLMLRNINKLERRKLNGKR